MVSESRPLSVLYALPAYKPAYHAGGPILSVAALAEGLLARGHRVVVYTTNSNLNEDLDVPTNRKVMVDGVEVWYFRRTEPVKRLLPFVRYVAQSSGYAYSRELREAVEQRIHEFDLAHLHMPFVYPTFAVGRAAIRAQKPLFYHQRGNYDPERLRFRHAKKILYIALVERPMMRKAKTLIALTEAERISYRALRVKTDCVVIPNGIDTNAYRRRPMGEFSQRFGIDGDRIIVLYLARLHPFKGVDLLLESFMRVAHQFPKATLVIAGQDEWGMETSIRQKAHVGGLDRRVLVIGPVSGSLKIDLLARANVFCLPSLAEGFSMATLEALASGTPVLISPGCHFPEVETHGAGWVIGRTADLWARKLSEVFRDPEMLTRMGEPAVDLVRRRYSWPKIIEQMEHAYTRGLGRFQAGGHQS
jgi:glycosyltransferase involved in cell wall biosynthesis